MIKLYQPKRAFGLPNPSAFCVKLETYLRMTDTAYELHLGQPNKGPKGKIPWIEDGSMRIGDSELIIQYLKSKDGDKLDGRLSALEAAQGHTIRKLAEESLYFISSHSKWAVDAGFEIYSAELFADMPAAIKLFVPKLVRKRAVGSLHAQGIARHTQDEIDDIGSRDVDALATLLGDQTFFFGETPTSIDASVFGVLGNLMDGPFESGTRRAALSKPNLRSYITNIRKTYFADLQDGNA